ncbi:MAG: c-type cytochrome [Rhodospirillaceae bacterium]
MRIIASVVLSGAILMGLSATAHADKRLEGMVKARQGYYQLISNNAGVLFAMAKGDVEYTAEAATMAANNLKTLSSLDISGLWDPATSKEAMPGKTRALQAMWDTYPAVLEKSKALNDAIAVMADEAGNGLDAVRANVKALGASCKGCHDDFRADSF